MLHNHGDKMSFIAWILLGLLAGLMNLSRTDGLLWLGITFLFTLYISPRLASQTPRNLYFIIRNSFIALLGFLLIMAPWYARNYNIYIHILRKYNDLHP